MFLAAAMAAVCAQADTWTDPATGYTWSYRINGDTAEITKENDWDWGNDGDDWDCGDDGGDGDWDFWADNTSSPAAISPLPTGAVTIPSTLGGKTVTRIGYKAFYNYSGLTSVTMPDSTANASKIPSPR